MQPYWYTWAISNQNWAGQLKSTVDAVTEVKTGGDSMHRETNRVQNFSSNILWKDIPLDTWRNCEDNTKNSMCVSVMDRVHWLVSTKVDLRGLWKARYVLFSWATCSFRTWLRSTEFLRPVMRVKPAAPALTALKRH
jgi:hypothetical protein